MSNHDYALVPAGYNFGGDDTSIIIDTPLGRFDFGDPLAGIKPDTVAQSPLPQIFIIDESGSMDKVVRDLTTGEDNNRMLLVLNGLNALIAAQQGSSRKDRIFATVIAIGSSVRILRQFMPIGRMKPIEAEELYLGDRTPLYQGELLALTVAARFQDILEARGYEPTPPVITALSDGGHNDQGIKPQVSLNQVAQSCASAVEELMPIHVVLGIALSFTDKANMGAYFKAANGGQDGVNPELCMLNVKDEDLPQIGETLRQLVDGASEKAENA